MKAGLHQPIQVYQANEHDPYGNPHQLARLALQAARKQDGKWKHEVQEDQAGRHDFPMPVNAVKIPANFFSQVARPDDQPLRE